MYEGVEMFWVCRGLCQAGLCAKLVQGYTQPASGGGKPGILLPNSSRPGGLER